VINKILVQYGRRPTRQKPYGVSTIIYGLVLRNEDSPLTSLSSI
jgi:hypothetical protein